MTVSLQKGNLDMDTHTGREPCEDEGRFSKLRNTKNHQEATSSWGEVWGRFSPAWNGTGPAGTLIRDCWPLDCEGINVCCSDRQSVCFAAAAPAESSGPDQYSAGCRRRKRCVESQYPFPYLEKSLSQWLLLIWYFTCVMFFMIFVYCFISHH